MSKYFILLFAYVLCITSCGDKGSRLEDYYIDITDTDLKESIREYDSVMNKNEIYPHIIEVYSKSVSDTLVCYSIKYLYSPAWWDTYPILYVANVNGKDVIFTSRSTDSPNNLVRLNKKIENELVRRNFPNIYKQYISGEAYTSIETTGGYSYQLFYYKGNLVLKKLYSRDIPISLVAKLIADKKIQVDEDGVKYNIDIDKYFEYWK